METKRLVVKPEFQGQIIIKTLPGIGKVKIDTNSIKDKEKRFYIKNGLGYLFTEICDLCNVDECNDCDEKLTEIQHILHNDTYVSVVEVGSKLDDITTPKVQDEYMEVEEEIIEPVEPIVVKKKRGRPSTKK
jgi:hypothetical protein